MNVLVESKSSGEEMSPKAVNAVIQPAETTRRGAIIEIIQPGDTAARYTITIIGPETSAADDDVKFAAFVVPLGREEDWIFCSEEGQDILRRNCRVDRMALITMHDGGHEYPDFQGIKKELKGTIRELAPKALSDRNEEVKFLTLPAQLKVDNRSVLKKEITKFGECLVENVMESGEHYRRLIFLNTGQGIQSEVKLKKANVNGEEIEEVDLNAVIWDYYILVCVGISLAVAQCQKPSYDVLLLGLGGGVVASLIHKCFENVRIKAIEIDEMVFKLAKEYFGLKPDERLSVEIEDGIVFLAEAARRGMKYDVMIIDVDTADPKVASSCPPATFFDLQVLEDVRCCLNENGLLLVNLVCRSLKRKKEIFARLRSIFAGVVSIGIRENVNEAVIAWKKEVRIVEEDINKAAREFFARSKKHDVVLSYEDIAGICQLVESIKV